MVRGSGFESVPRTKAWWSGMGWGGWKYQLKCVLMSKSFII
jgi:hypothetical protein